MTSPYMLLAVKGESKPAAFSTALLPNLEVIPSSLYQWSPGVMAPYSSQLTTESLQVWCIVKCAGAAPTLQRPAEGWWCRHGRRAPPSRTGFSTLLAPGPWGSHPAPRSSSQFEPRSENWTAWASRVVGMSSQAGATLPNMEVWVISTE